MSMPRTTSAAVIFAAALAALPTMATAAGAERGDDGAAHRFARMDADHDGKVTATEFGTFRTTQSAKQGKPAPNPRQIERAFARRDADRDGFLTLAELQAADSAKPGAKPAIGEEN